MRATPTRGFPRRPARGRHGLVLLACLLPFLGIVPGRVLYHCLVTGEFLTACCRDIGAVSVSLEDPLCCEEPEEEPASPPEPEDSTECDCCDLLLEEGHRREAAQPPGDGGLSQTHLALVAVGVPAPSHRALLSAASQPRLRAPPKRPRFLLFESFLS